MNKLVAFLLLVAAVLVVMSHATSAQARPVKAPPAFPAPVANPAPVSA